MAVLRVLAILFFAFVSAIALAQPFRPPSVPLVACDPYFSIWSPADRLTDADTVHWTGRPHRLNSLVTIDGRPYRVMGSYPQGVPALPQTSVEVLPTRTIYKFEGAGVALTLTFMTAALPEDIDLLSRPVTYVTWDFRSVTGEHEVDFCVAASAELAVNTGDQEVVAAKEKFGDLIALRMGSEAQPVLIEKGDDLRIDWGYFYLAAPAGSVGVDGFGSVEGLAGSFAGGAMQSIPPAQHPEAAKRTAAALVMRLGKVTHQTASRWIMLAYDDVYSIQYNHTNLRPYWRRNGWEAKDLLLAAARDYPSIQKRCAAFDQELMADLAKAGGGEYSKIAALAYRQCFAAGKFAADPNGQPLQFCKENRSNGCISTADVFYPMSPQFLLFGPSLAKSFLVPFMNYAASPRWKFPFAPHDLGTYPAANGQVYGGGEKTEENQMPVEESANLLLLMTAVAQIEGNADFAGLYWLQLETWARYLREKGFDPENQLCTDDFTGHLAHNVNLSAKAICALGAFAQLCKMRGDAAQSAAYATVAREYAARWVGEADDGGHSRLAFDRPGTWSQKYNLIWDRILGLGLFPTNLIQTEMAFYRGRQYRFGLPLDSRSSQTKLDWLLWTATLTQNRADFEVLVNPVFRFLNETGDRVPMADLYETKDARQYRFMARPVVGGVFAPLLFDRQTWRKYASRDKTKAAQWAPFPSYTPPEFEVIVPTAMQASNVVWRYTTNTPPDDWFTPEFTAAGWPDGPGGFGKAAVPDGVGGTEWTGPDIWLRREFAVPAGRESDLRLLVHHKEGVEIYINGTPAARLAGFNRTYELCDILPAARATLKPTGNILAIHCHHALGSQYIDAGITASIVYKR